MNIFSVASLIFGGIHGYRSTKNPIEPRQLATYICTTSPIFFFRIVGNNPHSILPALVAAPVINSLLIYTGHQVGRVCDFEK